MIEPLNNSPELDKPADIGIISKLYRDGLLSDDAFKAASELLRPVSSWFSWARQMLLFFGSALVLVGIIFFFAYNWAAMGKFIKFGLIEAGIIVCIVASHLRGRTRLEGKVLLFGGAILVGVFMAVYGQTYQTGADTFELFVSWAVLILGWVIVSEFGALWLVWLILLNTGAILYWQQVEHPYHQIGNEYICFLAASLYWQPVEQQPYHRVGYEYICFVVAILNGTALALREVCVLRSLEWLGGKWLRSILLIASLVALSLPIINWIIDFFHPHRLQKVDVIFAFMWLFAAVGGYALYRFKLRDMVPLVLIVLNTCIILLTFIGVALFRNEGFDEAGAAMFFALIILGVVSGAVFWLQQTTANMANEMKESGI